MIGKGHPERVGEAAPQHRTGWFKWFAIASGILAAVLLVSAIVLYVERRPIAALIVERYLASIGVPSEIEFEALSFGAFMARVNIAPSAKPDFSTESVEATLVYPAGFGIPAIASVRFVRPFWSSRMMARN